jgi:hypothetical protein
MERNRKKNIGKRKCKNRQNETTQTKYSEINKRVMRSIRKDKRISINGQAKLAEDEEKKGDIRELYNITIKLSQRKFRMNRPVKTKSGMFLTTQEEQLKR